MQQVKIIIHLFIYHLQTVSGSTLLVCNFSRLLYFDPQIECRNSMNYTFAGK